MAYKTQKSNASGSGCLMMIGMIGAPILIPFLVITFITFGKLQRKYIKSPTAQRVMDIRRIGPPLAGLALLSGLSCSSLIFAASKLGAILVGIFITFLLFVGYFTAKNVAVNYMGIIADRGKDALFLPHDMQSYTLSDYFSLRFLRDLARVDSIALSAINKMTRGMKTELYVHGAFGSRGLSMSSKQKRDECLAMIQSHSGKKGLLITEIEA